MRLKSHQVTPSEAGVIVRAPNGELLHVILWDAPSRRTYTMVTRILRNLVGRFQILVSYGTECACYEAKVRLGGSVCRPLGGTVDVDRVHHYENWHLDILRVDGFQAFVE